jgi:hypothetical protein
MRHFAMENRPPLPQPTPHTCPNCSEGLQVLPEFCPRCGASLSRSKTARLPLGFATGLLLVFGLLVFGAIGSCGGLFISPIFTETDPHGRGIVTALLIFSAPAFLIGIAGFILCLNRLIRGRKS